MTLPASGTITLANIQTEFGGANPISLSEYYRGGTYVQDNYINAAIPTSGAITMANFYNSSGQDILPDATDWTNTSGSTANLTGNTVTITGFTGTITLKVNYTAGTNGITLAWKKNAAAFVGFTSDDTITVVSGDTIQFRGTRGAPGADSNSVTIKNNTNGDSTMDTFGFTWT